MTTFILKRGERKMSVVYQGFDGNDNQYIRINAYWWWGKTGGSNWVVGIIRDHKAPVFKEGFKSEVDAKNWVMGRAKALGARWV